MKCSLGDMHNVLALNITAVSPSKRCIEPLKGRLWKSNYDGDCSIVGNGYFM